ncbi:hypothetical protein CR513_57158, partial [Mucuna pruriens]
MGNNTGFVKKRVLEKKKGETNAILVESIFHQAKANASSCLTWIQVGSRSTIVPTVPYIPYHRYKANAAKNEKTQQDASPNSHDLHLATSSLARVETGRDSPSETLRASITEKL